MFNRHIYIYIYIIFICIYIYVCVCHYLSLSRSLALCLGVDDPRVEIVKQWKCNLDALPAYSRRKSEILAYLSGKGGSADTASSPKKLFIKLRPET